jgi:hypothetical protein
MMEDPRFLPGFVLVAFTAALVLVTLLVTGLVGPGPRRPGLVAGGLPLSSLPPAVATAYASGKLAGLFAGMAEAGSSGTQVLIDACASLWLLQRVAWGACAASCLLGLVLGLLRIGKSSDDVPCSVRRALVLFLLPGLGLLVASSVSYPLGKALRVTAAAVMSSEKDDPTRRERGDALLEAEGLGLRGVASIAATSRFIALSILGGHLGGVTAAVVLLGLALPGFILAWRVRFGVSFSMLASTLWLLAAVGSSLVSFGVLDPLRLS